MSEEAITVEKRPLLEHLTELRRRVLVALAAFAVAVIVCYHFAPEIYGFLVRPLAASFEDSEHRRLIYTGLTEAFFTYLRLAMFGGLVLAFPILAGQMYLFIAPGLYKREKRMVLPYLAAGPALFFAGAALCYYMVFPMAWHFFISFEQAAAPGGLPIMLETRVSEYLGLSMHLILAFGFAFQLPVVLVLLTQFGMLSVDTLTNGRRYAAVIIAAVAAVITPPDVFSMVALAVPLYVLYELSILACRIIEKKDA